MQDSEKPILFGIIIAVKFNLQRKLSEKAREQNADIISFIFIKLQLLLSGVVLLLDVSLERGYDIEAVICSLLIIAINLVFRKVDDLLNTRE